MKIEPIKAFSDNYLWAISSGTSAAIVDPGDPAPVLSYLKSNSLNLTNIIITHHHADHIGGIRNLKSSFPKAKVYGPASENIPMIDVKLKQDDEVNLGELGTYKVLDVPGHTAGHIAYYGEGSLFIGDTVFACGCGRLFEGTAAQMVDSFEKIKQLPLDTKIYCAHEYTLSNIRFAKAVDPYNKELLAREQKCISLRSNDIPTVPFTLEEELQTNPFFAYNKSSMQQTASRQTGIVNLDSVGTFAAIRKWKDSF